MAPSGGSDNAANDAAVHPSLVDDHDGDPFILDDLSLDQNLLEVVVVHPNTIRQPSFLSAKIADLRNPNHHHPGASDDLHPSHAFESADWEDFLSHYVDSGKANGTMAGRETKTTSPKNDLWSFSRPLSSRLPTSAICIASCILSMSSSM